MAMKISTVIMDFDGVVIDSEREKFNYLKTTLKSEGVNLKKEYFKKMIGMKTSQFLRKYFKSRLSKNKINEISEKRRKAQLKNYLNLKLIKGVKSFISFLKSKGIKRGLATGTKEGLVNKVSKRNNLKFTFKVTGGDFKYSKPNPEVYKKAIKISKTSKKQILVVEDSPAGIISAKRAGLYCVAITTSMNKKYLKGADVIVNSFADIKKLII